MDSELLVKFIGYFPDYLSALSGAFLRFFGQPLSKQLYIASVSSERKASFQFFVRAKIGRAQKK